MAIPADELQFPVRQRGEIREEYLDDLRAGLREMVDALGNPAFTDDEIAIATADHGEHWGRADALDAVLFMGQQRAVFMAKQQLPRTAASITLRRDYVELWDLPYLEASGGSGPVSAPCAAETTWLGSTVLGDPAAVKGRDSAGRVYQVLFSVQSPVNGDPAILTLIGITTGDGSNIGAGEVITWVENVPLLATPSGTVVTDFSGGLPAETDPDYVPRLERRIRHKPGAGNNAQMRAWSESGGKNAVGGAWVYKAAFHAGSVLVAVAQKRGSTVGPLARVPSVGTLTNVRNFLASRIPRFVRWLVLPIVTEYSDMVLSLALGAASDAGWADRQPWPTNNGATPASITVVTDQTHIRIASNTAPPSTTDDPLIMVWHRATSAFIQLNVASVASAGGGLYDIVLASAPGGITLAVGQRISPFSEQNEVIAQTIASYFDSLGAGEIIDVSSTSLDDRAGYAFRWPKPNEEEPQRAGSSLIPFLQDALGPALVDGTIAAVSPAVPTLPANPIDGPNLLVAGQIGIYPL